MKKNKSTPQRPFFLIFKIQMMKSLQNNEIDLNKLVLIDFHSLMLQKFLSLYVSRSIILPSSINQKGFWIDS
jgi:hypothetical protein